MQVGTQTADSRQPTDGENRAAEGGGEEECGENRLQGRLIL